MRSIAITGANGQLGQSFRASMALFPELNVKFFDKNDLDITNPESIREALRLEHIDYLINCAAYTNVVQAENDSDAAHLLNGIAVGNLAEAAQRHRTHLIQISTDYVFDGLKSGPYFPSDPTNPINEYGKSKLLGEQLAAERCERHSIIRTSWVYSEFGSNFFTKIKARADQGETLWITEDYIGCPTYAPDLATYILTGISKDKLSLGVSHFAGKEVMTWYQLAKKLLPKADIRVASRQLEPAGIQRPKNSVLAS